MPIDRTVPSATPTPSTTDARPAITIVNVSASPRTMPTGLRRPPTALAESRAGRTGRTQGVIAVAAPATTANPIRISIDRDYRLRWAAPRHC